jgi:four helix bundle protein
MDARDWSIGTKPYDLRERLFNFACVITRMSQFLRTQGPIAVALCAQLLRSGTSAGANYEEADDGSSPKDVLAKRKIVLRELKETSFRLRVLRKTGILTPAHDPVINECAELVKIVATVLRNSRRRCNSPGAWKSGRFGSWKLAPWELAP